MIRLIVEFHEATGFWAFRVEEDGKLIHWRPGFRTPELAEQVGDAYVRQHLGGVPLEDTERNIRERDVDGDANG